MVDAHLEIDGVLSLARPVRLLANAEDAPMWPPLGQRIAVARDLAFGFVYEGVLEGWRRAGAEVQPFSPLAGEAPRSDADAVYLPGGYPELHAGALAGNVRFFAALRRLATAGAAVYGECGGYMVLGQGLVDGEGKRHRMAGLLPLETSFQERRLHLGYRAAELAAPGPLGPAGACFKGHEFHSARVVREDGSAPLFRCRDALGASIGTAGAIAGSVAGSFVHLVSSA